MNYIYHIAFLTSLLLILPYCTNNSNTFVITNNTELKRSDEPVVITKDEIIAKKGSIPNNRLPVVRVSDRIIPSQIDDINQDGSWDELAFTLNIPANTSKTVSIEFVDNVDYPLFPPKTNIRFGVKSETGTIENLKALSIEADEVPTEPFARFQMDGPAWENDKIGFRHYIDGRNARDLFGKKLPTMALDTVGISPTGELEDNYHVLLLWGRDILAVGNSLGLGGIAILKNNQPVRLGIRLDDNRNNVEMTSYQLITEGPVRSIFTLTYNSWEVKTNEYSLKNTVTIWAGEYGYKNKIELTSTHAKDTVLVGLVNINNDNPPVLNEVNPKFTLFHTFDKQTYEDEYNLGMALALPADRYLFYKESPNEGEGITNTFLNFIELDKEKAFEYYVFAGWELGAENFNDPDLFQNYIIKATQKLSNPVTIE